MTSSSYKFGGGESRKVFGSLPEGDYAFSVTECPEPYRKDTGNWVLNVRLSIQPAGETVFAPVWSGTDKNGEERDGIGQFLIAVNRAPKVGEEPDWRKIVGARGRCRLKVEIAQQGALAGKEINRVQYFYTPKEIGPTSAATQKIEQTQQKVKQAVDINELEPDDIPF
jgi:hypothetical protein